MSGFISTAVFLANAIVSRNDDVNQEPAYRQTFPQTRDGLLQEVDVLWVRSSFPTQSHGNGFNGSDAAHQNWEWSWPPTGVHVRKVISGAVQNSSGVAQAGATVYLFNTATGLLVDTYTSDGDGGYRVGDPNAVACFAVGYEAGSPDTTGATVNTLTGS